MIQAANPDWMPADPSGSLYLSRIQDFTTQHPVFASPRKAEPAGHESSLQERAQEYDRALKQSQYAARRRGGSTFLGMSSLHPHLGASLNPSASSIFGVGAMAAGARTVVLGDSQGSVHVPPAPSHTPASIPDEDLTADGLVDGSYIDGDTNRAHGSAQWEEEEDVGALNEEGGVIGLLAQIYSTRRDGTSRAI